jgi:hypothetical protein
VVATVVGISQTPPYASLDNLQTKEEAEKEDLRRFDFVNKIVEVVEKRKVLSSVFLLFGKWRNIRVKRKTYKV